MMKSDTKAEELRNEGNKFYAAKKFFDALIKYNESLCHATSDSNHLGLAFANRSAVYLEMKLYEKSLNNIELARAHNYPAKNLDILSKREEKCNLLINQSLKIVEPWSFFKMSFKPHEKLPFAVSPLELRINEKYGNYIITNQTLRVGDILAIEQPFVSVLLSESRFVKVEKSNKYQKCSNCLRDNQLHLIPCDSCSQGEKKKTFLPSYRIKKFFSF